MHSLHHHADMEEWAEKYHMAGNRYKISIVDAPTTVHRCLTNHLHQILIRGLKILIREMSRTFFLVAAASVNKLLITA